MNFNKFYNYTPDDRETGGYYPEKIHYILQSAGSGKKVLDVGCNDGYVTSLIKAQNNHVIGCDVSKKQIEKAKKNGIDARYHDITSRWPSWMNDFDVIILGDVIEHVFDTDFLLDNCFQALRPGGKLIITTPNVASLGRRLMLLFGVSPYLEYSSNLSTNGLPSVGHIRYYTKQNLVRQLEYHKFQNISVTGDKINVSFFSCKAPKILSTLSVNLFCTCNK
jgi:2-polyprenyl-3-methyl-5-hydroxy-6-metoxy-1,4-benzoquinol methylase